MALTENDFLTRLAKKELDELVATAIESGQTDPLTTAAASALAELETSVNPFALSDAMRLRLELSLAVPLLYARRANGVPEKHEKEQTWAREFLKDVRDGKFPNLVPSNAPTHAGRWGSGTKFTP